MTSHSSPSSRQRPSYPDAIRLKVQALGVATIPSPLGQGLPWFVTPGRRVLLSTDPEDLDADRQMGQEPASFELAGPREKIFFEPVGLTCGIVTCGGLCPGLNDVIRSVVHTLLRQYGVSRVLAFPYGYAGLSLAAPRPPLELTLDVVDRLHEQGGTYLGSSRGERSPEEVVSTLVEHGVQILFTVGGDGTQRAARAIAEEARRQGHAISVIGIPKTIDNDLCWVDRSFGFATAVEEARRGIAAAHTEARGVWNGIGLIQLMGRHSGFIAAHATLACSDVDYCLVPEVPFVLDGENGLLAQIEGTLARDHHCVLVVGEGAGQELIPELEKSGRDASGNVRLKGIGRFLRGAIEDHFGKKGLEIGMKYIDPSYLIRGQAANAYDSKFCLLLGQHAVHAGMAGKSELLIGYWNQHFTHVPMGVATETRKRLDPDGEFWQSVVTATGQPRM